MADVIKIFELDLDVDAAITSAEDLKKQVDSLKNVLDALKKSGDTNSRTYVEMEAQYKALRSEYNASQREIGKLLQLQGKEIKTVEQGRNALSVLNREWAKQADLYGENSEQAEALAKKTLDLRTRVKELEKGVGDNTRNVGNYSEGMKEALGSTTLFGKAQSVVTDILRVGRPIYNVLKADLISIRDNFVGATKSMQGFSLAQKAAASTTLVVNTALKLFRIALVGTGLGAVLVLLGSLVAYFGSTQKGINAVNRVLVPLKVVFESLFGVLQNVGEALVNVFSNPKKLIADMGKAIQDNFINKLNGAKQILEGLLTFDGSKIKEGFNTATKFEQQALAKIKNTADQVGASMSEAYKRGEQIAEIQQKLSSGEADFIIQLAKSKEEFKEANKIAEDQTKNLSQREAAAQRSLEILARQNAIQEERNELEVQLLELQNQSNDTSDAERAELARKKAELIQNNAERLESETTQQNKLNQIRKEGYDKARDFAKQQTEAAITESKTRLAIFIEENKGKADTLAEGLANEEAIRDKRLEILEQELKAGKVTQAEAELERLKIKNEFLEKQKDLTVDFAEEELAIFKNANQSRIDANQVLNDAIVNQEIQRLEAIAEKEREYQEKRLAEGVISEIEYNEAIQTVNDKFRTAKAELETQLKEQKAQAAVIDLENERAVRQEQYDYDLGMQLADLERRKQQELKIAEQTGADKNLIEKKYADEEDDIRETVAANKRQLASDTFGNLVTILGKESAAGKAAAVAQTTIDTYQAATAAYKALAGIPVVGPALGAVAAGAAVASGLANVKKIVSTKEPNLPKAEKGGLFTVGGKRHAAGGTKFYGEDGTAFEAEQGELITVLNRNAAIAMNGLNKIYPAGGGRSGNYFADGGIVQRAVGAGATSPNVTLNTTKLSQEDIEAIASQFTNAVRQLPRPVTDVKDIINQVNNYNQVVDGATI